MRFESAEQLKERSLQFDDSVVFDLSDVADINRHFVGDDDKIVLYSSVSYLCSHDSYNAWIFWALGLRPSEFLSGFVDVLYFDDTDDGYWPEVVNEAPDEECSRILTDICILLYEEIERRKSPKDPMKVIAEWVQKVDKEKQRRAGARKGTDAL